MAERDDHSDCTAWTAKLPEKIRVDLQKWYRQSNKVSIFLTGKVGAGKSALVNGLVGATVAKEGENLDPTTTEVKGYRQRFRSVNVTVWDSPGLQEGVKNEAKYLEDMQKKCSDVDVYMYCVPMTLTRFLKGCADVIAMKKLTEVFGPKMWENAMFVLTFANIAGQTDSEMMEAEDAQKKELFKLKIDQWKEKLTDALVNEVDIDVEVVNQIDVVPVGYANTPALLDRDHWLSPFWFAALYATNPRAQPALIRLNQHRLVDTPDKIRQEDLEKFTHEQPLIFSKRGFLVGEKYGDGEEGKEIGLEMAKLAFEEKLSIGLYYSLIERARKLRKTFIEFIMGLFVSK